jgi:hypothetical protein
MRPKINYVQIGLKVGDVITFRDGVTTATIAGPHTVIYQGDESALQNGPSLADLYEAFHGDEE